MADQSSKGRAQRVTINLKVNLKYPDRSTFEERFAQNISRTGIFIRARDPVPVGHRVRFEYRLADASRILRGVGIVRWIRSAAQAEEPDCPPGMGIEFIDVDAQSDDLITQIVAKHGEGARAPFKKARPVPRPTPSPPRESVPRIDTDALPLDSEEQDALDALLGGAVREIGEAAPPRGEAPAGATAARAEEEPPEETAKVSQALAAGKALVEAALADEAAAREAAPAEVEAALAEEAAAPDPAPAEEAPDAAAPHEGAAAVEPRAPAEAESADEAALVDAIFAEEAPAPEDSPAEPLAADFAPAQGAPPAEAAPVAQKASRPPAAAALRDENVSPASPAEPAAAFEDEIPDELNFEMPESLEERASEETTDETAGLPPPADTLATEAVIVDLCGPEVLSAITHAGDLGESAKIAPCFDWGEDAIELSSRGVWLPHILSWPGGDWPSPRARAMARRLDVELAAGEGGAPALRVGDRSLAIPEALEAALAAVMEGISAGPELSSLRVILPATASRQARDMLDAALASVEGPEVELLEDCTTLLRATGIKASPEDKILCIQVSAFEARLVLLEGAGAIVAARAAPDLGFMDADLAVFDLAAAALLREHEIDVEDDPSLRKDLLSQVKNARSQVPPGEAWEVAIAGAPTAVKYSPIVARLMPSSERLVLASYDLLVGHGVMPSDLATCVLAGDEVLWPGLAEAVAIGLGLEPQLVEAAARVRLAGAAKAVG